ncbi:MAG: hypothetical protein ACKVH8_02185 [Pirellulales bacterium]
MSQSGGAVQYRKLRAPQQHTGKLLEPSLDQLSETLATNQHRLSQFHGLKIAGVPFLELQTQARHHLLSEAKLYSFAYRDPFEVDPAAPLILSGHQPALFHPGVWFKNFVIDRMAKLSGGTAINLIIDNDTISSPAITVPSEGDFIKGSPSQFTQASVAYDQASAQIPWQMRQVVDQAMFESFGERVREKLTPNVKDPLIDTLWPLVTQAIKPHGNIGRAFAQARHALEAQSDLKTLELPLGQLVDSSLAFHLFFLHVTSQIVTFQEVYNSAIREYRSVHKIRSSSHPVPELEQNGNQYELPFWVWSTEHPQRQRLFVEQTASGFKLSDNHNWSAVLSNDREQFQEQFSALAKKGISLRPRALMTTMFSRIFLSDLFVHGIGGAKYDQLTDTIIERFFGFSAPSFATATATLHLPLQKRRMDTSQTVSLQRQLRDLRFNPDRLLEIDGLSSEKQKQVRQIISEKQRWIQSEVPVNQRLRRHLGIQEANVALLPFLEPTRAALLDKLDKLKHETRNERIAFSREYSFSLFPLHTLPIFLLDLASDRP